MKPSTKRICSALLALCLLAGGCGMLAACQPAEKYSLETENLIDAVLNDVYDWGAFDEEKFFLIAASSAPGNGIEMRILYSDHLEELRQRPDALPALLNRCSQLLESSFKCQPYSVPLKIVRTQYLSLNALLRRDPALSAQMTEADIARLDEMTAAFFGFIVDISKK